MMKTSLVLVVALAATSFADDKQTAKIAKDGTATLGVARPWADGAPLAKLVVKLPSGWQRVKGSDLKFVPKTAKYERPDLIVDVGIDNVEPADVVTRAKASVTELGKKVVGGGTIVKVITDTRALELGPHGHGFMTSREVDATNDRNTHYVETTCYLFADNQKFALRIVGFSDVEHPELVGDFEKVCESARL